VIAEATGRFEREGPTRRRSSRDPPADAHVDGATRQRGHVGADARTARTERTRSRSNAPTSARAALNPALAQRALDLATSGDGPSRRRRPSSRGRVRCIPTRLGFSRWRTSRSAGAGEHRHATATFRSWRARRRSVLARSCRLHAEVDPGGAPGCRGAIRREILRRGSFSHNRPESGHWVKAATSGGCQACRAAAEISRSPVRDADRGV